MSTEYKCIPFELDYYESAPQQFIYERILECSPDELFDIFEDEHSWPVWGTGIAKVDWTSPKPIKLALHVLSRSKEAGMEVYETFIAWERGKHMAFCFTGTTQEVWTSFGENYLVKDLGDGKCHLTWTVAYTPCSVFKMIHPLVKPMMKFWLGMLANNLGKYVKRKKLAGNA